MTLQNRVTPFGEIVADPARGLLMGNRGILHDDERLLGRARWRHSHWIACTLDPGRGERTRIPMTPGRYTELFFLDEAVALAAGHRPCAECRRADFRRFQAAWSAAAATHGSGPDAAPTAPNIDRILHAARLAPGPGPHPLQKTCRRPFAGIPDGAFVARENQAWLVLGARILQWTPARYQNPAERPSLETATVLTPEPSLAILANGYRPKLHPSADPQDAQDAQDALDAQDPHRDER